VDAVGLVGLAVMVVSGAVVSTIQVKESGVASVLPAASVARTEKVCEPSSSPVMLVGGVQAAYAPVSSLHWKLDPVSLDVKEKAAELDVDGFGGLDVIDVSGAVVSSDHVQVAGVESTPAALIDLTENVCDPSAIALSVVGEVHAK